MRWGCYSRVKLIAKTNAAKVDRIQVSGKKLVEMYYRNVEGNLLAVLLRRRNSNWIQLGGIIWLVVHREKQRERERESLPLSITVENESIRNVSVPLACSFHLRQQGKGGKQRRRRSSFNERLQVTVYVSPFPVVFHQSPVSGYLAPVSLSIKSTLFHYVLLRRAVHKDSLNQVPISYYSGWEW